MSLLIVIRKFRDEKWLLNLRRGSEKCRQTLLNPKDLPKSNSFNDEAIYPIVVRTHLNDF